MGWKISQRMSKIRSLFRLSHEQKGVKLEDVNGPLFKKMNRLVAIKIAVFLDKYTNITPNQVTTFVFFMNFVVAYLFYINRQPYLIFGGITYLLSYFLDFVDGSLARIKNLASDFGTWIDHIPDTFSLTLIFFATSAGVYNKVGDYRVWLFGFLASTAYIFARYTYEKFIRLFPFGLNVIEKEKRKRKFVRNFFYDGPLVAILFVLSAFFNKMYLLLIICGVYGWFFCIVQYLALSKKIPKH